jgi:hypothetical protein
VQLFGLFFWHFGAGAPAVQRAVFNSLSVGLITIMGVDSCVGIH